jgi:hypothetical protein
MTARSATGPGAREPRGLALAGRGVGLAGAAASEL